MGSPKRPEVKPFLKWAGGKRWLPELHSSVFKEPFARLVEPFAGGAAVFFHLRPQRAWLNDLNKDLINVYSAIRDEWKSTTHLLEFYHAAHSKPFYYHLRSSTFDSSVERAAQFIYLNRTCFNGLYRVNLDGEFNVPKGTKRTVLFPDDNFEAVSRLLKRAKLTTGDFEDVVNQCGRGDLVYADPPYTVKHNLNGFVKYNEKLFGWADQIRLRDAVLRAKSRGAVVIVSNAAHESVRELYTRASATKLVERHSIMAASSDSRRATTELLIQL